MEELLNTMIEVEREAGGVHNIYSMVIHHDKGRSVFRIDTRDWSLHPIDEASALALRDVVTDAVMFS